MQHVSRREFLKWMAAGTAAAAVPRFLTGAEGGGGRPNILYIMSDDHASHAMSCYGSRINKTPNLDRIAAEGMRLDNCFCTNSICGPSRAVLLTGKYSHRNGFYRNGQTFDGSQQTFPKLLRKAGYQTAMIGKWHLRSEPTGFDYWNVLPGQGAYHDPVLIEMGRRKKHRGYVTDLITDITIDWIRNRRDKTRPFCVLCHHKAPHRNWQPDAKHARMYENEDRPLPETFWDDYRTRSDAARQQQMHMKDLNRGDLKQPVPEGLDKKAELTWRYQRYIKDYLRCIASVDDNVGRLLKYLDESGLAASTVVIYTSDQGFYLGDHGWFDKRFMYEESLRMPFVVRYPKEIKPGSVSDDICVNIDFAPTFLDYAGAAAPADIQGRSLRGVLGGKAPADWRTSMYYHYYEYPAVHMVKRHYGVRTQRHKLIHFYHDIDAWELYDLKKDPHELNNVYGSPACAAVVKELKDELARLRKLYGDTEDPMKYGGRPPQRPTGPPEKGLQLHLAFAEAAGTNEARDQSGKKRHLTCKGTKPAAGRKGGRARSLNGKGDYLDLPKPRCPRPHNTPVTVLAWVRPSKPDGTILGHGGASWGYMLHVAGGKAAFSTRVADKLTTIVAPDKLPDGWVHVAGQLAEKGRMTLYVNGQAVATGKAPGLLAQDPFDNLQVGADSGSSILDKGDNYYAGLIGDLKVIYGKLAAAEIAREAAK